MVTIAISIVIGIAAIWGEWDWRVAVTAWIIGVVADAMLILIASDEGGEY